MNELIFDYAIKGFPTRFDDLNLMQNAYKASFSDVIKGLGYNEDVLIINGCEISVNDSGLATASYNVTEGSILYYGTIYKVAASDYMAAPYVTLAIIESTYYWDGVISDTFDRIYKNGDIHEVWRSYVGVLVSLPATWIGVTVAGTKRLVTSITDQVITDASNSTLVKESMRDYTYSATGIAPYYKGMVIPVIINPTSEYDTYVTVQPGFRIHTNTISLPITINKITTSAVIDLEIQLSKIANDSTNLGNFVNTLWSMAIPYKINDVFQTQLATVYFHSETTTTVNLRVKLNTTSTGTIKFFLSTTFGFI